jgi:Fe-S cluster assembly protein SufD
MAVPATRPALPTDPLPGGAKWLRTARDAAAGRLAAMGLPQPRDEYWKFTRPDSLTQADVPAAALFDPREAPVFGEVDRIRLVFVDGVFAPDQSDDPAGENLEIARLAEIAETDIHWAAGLFGRLEADGHSPVARPLAALNTARASDGVAIRATGPVAKPVSLIYLHKSETSDAILHHLVKVEDGASLTLLENGPAAARFNKCMEVELGDGAAFNHVRAQGRDHERRAVTHAFARLGQGASYKSFTLTANGRLTRNEQVITLAGAGATAHVAGAALGDGAFHQDDTVFVHHAAPDCESRQVFKKVLRNGATGVFQGKILVDSVAQRTDGYQIAQALLLDGDSQFLVKPELEIYADDVKCSHGSTSGGVDADARFYLMSRGIPRAEAEDLLVLSFLAEAIAEIEDATLAAEIHSRLAAWLERHRSRRA